MGSGSWHTDTYEARAAAKRAAGKPTFDYSAKTTSAPRESWKPHETLDPMSVNKDGPNKDKNIRESFDNDDHPEATPIAVLFDVTGSMHRIPTVLQQKLPELHGLLLRKGYVPDPQIMFGAIGDAYVDRVPLQVGQFESDNRMDECLENILLEGGGGGHNRETYELAMYFMANHVDLDSLNKRGKKGYLFLMGDEQPYDAVNRDHVKQIIGDDIQADLPTEEVVASLTEKFETFFLFVEEGSYTKGEIVPKWAELLGERALVLEKADAVCESIALTIGLLEGAVTYEDGMADLEEVSTDLSSVKAAGKALASVGASTSAVVSASDDVPGADEGGSTTERM